MRDERWIYRWYGVVPIGKRVDDHRMVTEQRVADHVLMRAGLGRSVLDLTATKQYIQKSPRALEFADECSDDYMICVYRIAGRLRLGVPSAKL